MFKLPDTSNPAEINGLMTVDAWTCGRSGVYVQNAIHTSTGLSGKMIVQGSKLVSVQLDAPEEATNTFSFDSRLFLIQEDGPKAVQPDQQKFSKKSCSPTWLSRAFGAELCAELDFYNQLLKGVDVKLSADGAELASIRTALRTDLKGASGRYEPTLVISQRGRELLNFQGYFSYVAVSKYGFDFQLKHLTVRPIRLTGKIGNLRKHFNSNLKSVKISRRHQQG